MILLLLALPAWSGDQEVARLLFEQGRKVFRAKKYKEAEKYLGRALAEHTPFPEASYWYGQALEKLGRAQEAAHAYRVCIAAVDGLDAPPPKWKSASSRAARALSKLRRQFAALDGVNRKYIKRFLDFGKRHRATNPQWARRAFETVLAIDPAHSAAKAYLAKLPAGARGPVGKPGPGAGTGAATGKGKAWGTPLITPEDLGDWDPGESANWSIDGRVITGDAVGRSGKINWLDKVALKGKYALRVSFRVIRDGGSRRTIGLFIGDGGDAWWAIMLDEGDSLSLVRVAGASSNEVKSRSVGRTKWTTWHTLRVEVDGSDASIFLDDKKLIEITVPRRQAFAGGLGLFIQNARVEFKDLELRK